MSFNAPSHASSSIRAKSTNANLPTSSEPGPTANRSFTPTMSSAFPAFSVYPTTGIETGSSPLDVAERSFALLMHGPRPLSVDGAELGHGLPARTIPLNELRAILLHPACDRTTRDEVWRHLVTQARTHRGAWMLAAVALALPMLRRLVKALGEKVTAEREDLEAEVLACYMEALDRVKLAWPHPVLRLSRLTQFAVIRNYSAERPELLSDPDQDVDRQTLTYPTGHADLLLTQAVRQSIITPEMAEVIGLTRLENIPLSVYCRRRNLLYCAVLKRRQRAEAALYRALMNGDLSNSC
ncbi:hypothetical protein [Sinosporangium siamense]|uniref:Uncharacterized protein n=1 Tax=Sinosporangium siamense TaxID=1367973 RepID=A0A919RM32_9ACTN|nr:hypothetical protein [Sinosporangium siamense]GII96295.1 hypothetical protein Ssi02_65260 [Sinosporangium siamense]